MTTLRIDKLLWFLRFAKSRSLAQVIVHDGHIRLNGERVTRCAHSVTMGDRLVMPLGTIIRVVEILALPSRRGPAIEATACYRVLDGMPAYPIAAPDIDAATKEDPQA